MARVHGRNVSIYVDNSSGACQSISGDLNSATLTYTSEAPDVTGFGNTTRQRLGDGLIEWQLDVSGFWDNAGSTTAGCILFPIVTGSSYVQFGPTGSTAGNLKLTGSCLITEFNMEAGVEDALAFSCVIMSRTGSLSSSTW